MEWLGAATWTGRQRLSEREVSESNPAKLHESYATGFLDSARNDFYDITPTVAPAPMNRFAQRLREQSISLCRCRPEILQVNVGKLCNLICVHCHGFVAALKRWTVEAGMHFCHSERSEESLIISGCCSATS